MASNDRRRPLFVGAGIAVTERTLTQALLNQGLLEGPQARKRINKNIRPLVDAVYHVLSGGTVRGSVPGTIEVKGGNEANVGKL